MLDSVPWVGSPPAYQQKLSLNPRCCLHLDARRTDRFSKVTWGRTTRHLSVLQHNSSHEKPKQTLRDRHTMQQQWLWQINMV